MSNPSAYSHLYGSHPVAGQSLDQGHHGPKEDKEQLRRKTAALFNTDWIAKQSTSSDDNHCILAARVFETNTSYLAFIAREIFQFNEQNYPEINRLVAQSDMVRKWCKLTHDIKIHETSTLGLTNHLDPFGFP